MTNEAETTSDKPVFGATGRRIVYDKDGKPCRTCNTLLDFQSVMGKPAKSQPQPQPEPETKLQRVDPPDVEQLGRSSWTLLHSIAASYPDKPDDTTQNDMKQFVTLFGKFYPCWFCAEDFNKYVEKNKPEVTDLDSFGKWLCRAHNDVNKKLGKPEFDCNLWKQRWKDGWDN